mmetsp:Transcript_79632/g.165422  ORF Transcript_79632/g.165422 Transcript_79632/m.165422 type:complete len:237 (+) Transcript_79632:696-1406(+)
MEEKQHRHHGGNRNQCHRLPEHFVPNSSSEGAKDQRHHDEDRHCVAFVVFGGCVAPTDLHGEAAEVVEVARDEGRGGLEAVPQRHHVLDREDDGIEADNPPRLLFRSLFECKAQLHCHYNDCKQGAEDAPHPRQLDFSNSVNDNTQEVTTNDGEVKDRIWHQVMLSVEFRVDDTIAHLKHIACHHRGESLVPCQTDDINPTADERKPHSEGDPHPSEYRFRHGSCLVKSDLASRWQ